MFERITILPDFADHPFVAGWREVTEVVVKTPDQVSSDDIVVCSGDLTHEHVRRWIERNQTAIYIARGYLGNHLHKQRNWWRATVNGWANLTAFKPPHSRWDLLGLPRHPIKPASDQRVLIAPSKMTTEFWTGEKPHIWAERMSREYAGHDVRIRYKEGKSGSRWATLFQDLAWADLVVSQSSAITVEAKWFGCQTRSTEPCPTWVDLPHDEWLEHIAWSQFTNAEWASGEALKLICSYYGNLRMYPQGHQYRFTY